MNSKIKTIKVTGEEKEIYITSDGKRFEDKFDAQFYQDELDLEVIEKKCFKKFGIYIISDNLQKNPKSYMWKIFPIKSRIFII